MDAGEEVEARARAGTRGRPRRARAHVERRLVAEEQRADDRVVAVRAAQVLCDQLEAGRVRHSCPSCRRRRRRSRAGGRIDRQLGLDELLGAASAVARAPAQVGLGQDHRPQLEDAVHQRLGPGRAARHVDVDRHELVGRHDRVVVEHAHRRRAGAHRDRPARLDHLVVDPPYDRRHLDRHAAGQDQQVGLARRGAERLAAEARDVDARADDRHHLDRTAGEPEGGGEDRVGSGPAGGLVERRREDALLDVLLELGALQLAVEHLACGELARAEVAHAARSPSWCRVTSIERSSPPDVHERDHQQRDEDDGLPQREGPERLQLDGDRVEEDDLDVEEDEQHRDQVEADPEAEVLLHLGRQAALVRIGRRWHAGGPWDRSTCSSIAKTRPRMVPSPTKTSAGR